MIQKYELPQFLKYMLRTNFTDDRAKHTAEIVKSYYDLSYYQMLDLSKTTNEFFDIQDPTQDIITEYLKKSWSYAYAMYALLRTSIEALSIFRQMVGDVRQIDPIYRDELKNIIDIANHIVKHPMFKHGQLSEGVQPVSLDVGGGIDVAVQSDTTGQITKKELDPMRDFYAIRNYIEHIFENLP